MRTQAATVASAADQSNAAPHEGDGYLYEHLEDRDELWLDFIADTGDGGWVGVQRNWMSLGKLIRRN